MHKTNVLVHAGGLWARIFAPGRRGVPRRDDRLPARRRGDRSSWSADPERFDVIVTDNLFGDILTDLAAAVTGGIGLAASGNLNAERHEPVDVRAGARLGARHRRPGRRRPDRGDPVGRAAARPPRSADAAAASVEDAVVADLADRGHGDRGAPREVGDAVARGSARAEAAAVAAALWATVRG